MLYLVIIHLIIIILQMDEKSNEFIEFTLIFLYLIFESVSGGAFLALVTRTGHKNANIYVLWHMVH